jgi:hypothetical protein
VRRFLSLLHRPAALLPVLAVLALGVAAGPAAGQGQPGYHDHAALTKALQALAGANKTVVKLASIGKTSGGRDIWALEIAAPGAVTPEKRPALLIAAGFEGDDLVGTEIALAAAETLAKNAAAEATVYLVPRVNPDGAEGFFAPLKTGAKTNLEPYDDDNDGRVDEDGPEDLNGDGLITVMRVPAAGGEYMIDPEDPRLMKRADPKKGETGAFKLYTEGIDNDGDGFINEDPPGGTDPGRNFAHDYPYYKPGAGPHMVSAAEARALMAWIVAHRNVAAVLTFGESDNLIVPPTGAGRLGPARELDLVRFADTAITAARSAGYIQAGGGMGRGGRFFGGGEFSFEMLTGGGRPSQRGAQAQAGAESSRFMMPDRKAATTVASADYDYFKAVSDKYIEMTGIRQPLYVREPQGAFFQYAYFQFGVPAFSTPGFGLTTAEPGPGRRMAGGAGQGPGEGGPPAQSGQGAPAGRASSGGAAVTTILASGGPEGFTMMQMGPGGFGQGQAAGGGSAAAAAAPGIDKQVLKWFDGEKIDGFVRWTKAKHPEFGEVEIGGFRPYSVTNPPAAQLSALGAAHAKFAAYLLSRFARLRVASFEAAALGGGLYRLKAEVENVGFWPTSLAQAVTARSVKPAMVQLGVEPGAVISGSAKTSFIPTLAGSGSRAKYDWLIKGKTGEDVELLVQSEKGGSATARVTLK